MGTLFRFFGSLSIFMLCTAFADGIPKDNSAFAHLAEEAEDDMYRENVLTILNGANIQRSAFGYERAQRELIYKSLEDTKTVRARLNGAGKAERAYYAGKDANGCMMAGVVVSWVDNHQKILTYKHCSGLPIEFSGESDIIKFPPSMADEEYCDDSNGTKKTEEGLELRCVSDESAQKNVLFVIKDMRIVSIKEGI